LQLALIDNELNFGRNHNDVAVGGGLMWGKDADLAGENGPALTSAIVGYPGDVHSFLVFNTASYKLISLISIRIITQIGRFLTS
jgi:hypothetical protein